MDESIDLPSMEQQRSTSHLSGGNAAYVEDLYEAYLKIQTMCRSSGANTLTVCQRSTQQLMRLPHSVLPSLLESANASAN